jgi:hypothetical protein
MTKYSLLLKQQSKERNNMNLNRITTPTSGDMYVLWSGNSNQYSALSLGDFITYLEGTGIIPAPAPEITSQYYAPSATGWTATVTVSNTRLIITPAAGYATATIALPSVAVDKDVVIVTCTNQVTTLTVTPGSGHSVTGAPAALAANAYFTLMFDSLTSTWYRTA